MANQEVKVFFKVEGIDGYITDLGDLQDALNGVQKQTEETSAATDEIGKGNKASKFFSTIKGKGVTAFKALRGAIAATGIGLLITAFTQLVDWFKQSDTGAKILEGTTAALGVVFDQIRGYIVQIIDKFKPLFEDPIGAIKDFGKAIQDNITSKVTSIIEGVGLLGTAILQLFKRDFEGAAATAKDAFQKIVIEGTIAGDVIDGVNTVVDGTTKAFKKAKDAIVDAVDTSNAYVDAQIRLKERSAELTVENAKLNQELETQQKIADDTTRSYEERKAALDRVNAANEQLADNAVEQAALEKDVLERALELATTDEERRELKQQLADATANLIDAETAAEIVRLESAQLNRELDQEEKDRLEELKKTKEENDKEAAENAQKAREKELAAIKAQNEAVVKAEEDLQNAKFNAAQQGIAALSTLAGDNEKIQNALFLVDKAVAIGKVIVDSIKAKAANLAYAAGLGPAGPAYLAAANQAVNLNTAASIATITAASIAKFKNGGGAAGGNDTNLPNPSNSINYSFGQTAGENIVPGQEQQQQPQPIQAYVVATDVSSAQQANQQIENLSRL